MSPGVASVALVVCMLFATVTLNPVHKTFSKSVDQFTGHFYKEVASQNPNENVILSGLSAHVIFSLLSAGARGETKKQLADALFVDDLEAIQPSIRKTIDEMNGAGNGVTLRMANRVYARPSPTGKLDSVSPTFRSTVQDIFRSDVRQVDFSKSVATAAEINGWVEAKTNHRIKDLIDSSSLDGLTSAVLVNAIYFKGVWATKFDQSKTKKGDFTRADGKKVTVDYMLQDEELLFNDDADLDAKVIRLPYRNRDASFVIILPNQVDGLKALESKLANGIDGALKSYYRAKVDLKLPKFKIETTIDVKPPLQNLGVTRVFNPTAELGGMMKEESGIYVSKAIQKAFIEVNEDGAEAAVATGLIAVSYSLPMKAPRRQFYADHPFFYAIQYKGTTLFSGSFKTGVSAP